MKEWLILVYPEGGGQPKEVWWLQSPEECEEREKALADAGEEFITFKAEVLRMFHSHTPEELGIE